MPAIIIPLPNVIYSQSSMRPVRPGDVNQMEGRRTESHVFGTPYWTLQLTAEKLTTTEAALLDAFEMDAEDGCLLAAHDPHRPRPIAYQGGQPLSGVKAGGGAFNGDAVLESITDPLTIVVNGLPAGFILSPGDYVEVRKSPYVRSLHRIHIAAVASGAGVVTLSIRFFLDTQAFTLPCMVRFEKPTCLMTIDKGSFSSVKTWPNYNASFAATEVFPDGA
jgi:hypothetical protein